MLLVRVVLSLWLKLIVPVPEPKAMEAAVTVPAESLVPKRPILSVPVEPLDAAIVIAVAVTSPPLATVSVPLPETPTARALLLDQMEPSPVTRAELFEDVELLPMYPKLFCTLAPLEITMLLLLPLLPKTTSPLNQREFVPVTSTELFEDVELLPMFPVPITLPSLEITRLLAVPLAPTLNTPEFDQTELLPVTSTELFDDEVLLPIFPAVLLTVP